ncbi:flavoprotein [Virgisporangium ochraceum]|uniref:Flavoprotein n=1 Tax=Virgisporangium ochraceum TaxID=65505 RepID=A0A8J4EFU7_9ACTN|nr:flavoprotein [Virgisporangium ochraceum]GIJ74050.1 flavoprotein [Virgisporangium ochraceum]
MSATPPRRVLHLIVCGGPRAGQAGNGIRLAHARGWDVVVVATPAGLDFIDQPALEALSARPVFHAYRRDPDTPSLPPADATLVCPATFNTINKLAAGFSDNLALGLLTEAVGTRAPLVIAPALNSSQAGHPAFARSVNELRAAGAVVLIGPGIYEPVAKGTGRRPYRWDRALDAVDDLDSRRSEPGRT